MKNRVQRVAMESTGVYWRPVWNILERKPAKLDLILLNPQHVKALPGHKTDRVDAARIAELTQYGLVRASFVPPEEIRELRDLVRRRVHLSQDRSRVSSRIHRLLELQNIKISSVLTKVTSKNRPLHPGRAGDISEWIKPESLALLATHKRVRDKRERLKKALHGCHLTDHFQFLLRELLDELDRLTAKMKLMEERIAERMIPYGELLDRLCKIPGVEKLTAWTLIAEIGVDMSRFQTARASGELVRLVPGQCRERGQTAFGKNQQGEQIRPQGAVAGSMGGGANYTAAYVLHDILLPGEPEGRHEESCCGGGPQDPGRCLSYDPGWFRVSGTRPGLL